MRLQKLEGLIVYDADYIEKTNKLGNGECLYFELLTEKEFISRQYRAYYFAVVVKAFVNTFGSVQEAHEKLGERFLRRRFVYKAKGESYEDILKAYEKKFDNINKTKHRLSDKPIGQPCEEGFVIDYILSTRYLNNEQMGIYIDGILSLGIEQGIRIENFDKNKRY